MAGEDADRAEVEVQEWRPWAPRRRAPLDTALGRRLTAELRQWPDFIIIGAQRAGTTSLYRFLMGHPRATAARLKELHYFDKLYRRGHRWYRSNFPLRRAGQVTGEATPYMLFHPLCPGRSAADLPATTRFIALLRDPVQRALSHYWLNVNRGVESESFADAMAAEAERLAGTEDVVRRGENSFNHQTYSYAARGRYAEQLARWFEAVGRDRVLVLQSETLFASVDAGDEVLRWLRLEPQHRSFPKANGARRKGEVSEAEVAAVRRRFASANRDLEELVGRPFWPGGD